MRAGRMSSVMPASSTTSRVGPVGPARSRTCSTRPTSQPLDATTGRSIRLDGKTPRAQLGRECLHLVRRGRREHLRVHPDPQENQVVDREARADIERVEIRR